MRLEVRDCKLLCFTVSHKINIVAMVHLHGCRLHIQHVALQHCRNVQHFVRVLMCHVGLEKSSFSFQSSFKQLIRRINGLRNVGSFAAATVLMKAQHCFWCQ